MRGWGCLPFGVKTLRTIIRSRLSTHVPWRPYECIAVLRLTSPFLSIVNANCPTLDHVEVAGRLRTMAHARTGSY